MQPSEGDIPSHREQEPSLGERGLLAAQPWNPMELSGSQIAVLPFVARAQGTGQRASL